MIIKNLLFHNKKGQYAKAMRRMYASQDRANRLYKTNYLLNEGYSIPEIAIALGVSSNTIMTYVSEINADKEHFNETYKQQKAKIKLEEEEQLRRKNRNLKEIMIEEIPKSFIWSIGVTIILYLTWWIPSLTLYIISNKEVDITQWVWGNNFVIVLTVVFTIIYLIFILNGWAKVEEYKSQKIVKRIEEINNKEK